jgi:putative FmdB family regulatory protein
MPNYDYQCNACGYLEEIFQRMSDAPLDMCPKCGKQNFGRIITGGAGVLYKGEGWYVTDYSKKSSGGKESVIPSATPPVEIKTPPTKND